MQKINRIYFLAFFSVLPFFSFGQNHPQQLYKRCPEKTINYEQGLLNNGTTAIITDALGFTWISAVTGMQRYNGYRLETINPVINNEITNINSSVYFFALQNGLMWISYKKGILEYDPNTNSFNRIISLPAFPNQNFSLIPVKETNEGIWCLEQKKGLVIYSPKGVFMRTVSGGDNSFVENVFSQPDILNNTTFTINKNCLFIYNGKDQIEQINFQTQEVNYINTANLISIACINSHVFIVSNKALTSFNINNKKVEKIIPLSQIIQENINSSSIRYSGDNQLLLSINGHLFEFDTLCNYQKELTDLNRKPFMAQGYIRTIYSDQFSRIWLLTNDDIKRIQNVGIPFEHFIYPNTKNNFVRSIYYDEKKHFLLAGCFDGGIQLYDTLGNSLWQQPVISDKIKDINAIEKLTDDNYLVETIRKGWYILNLPTKKINTLGIDKSIENAVPTHQINFVNNLQRINNSTLFIATTSNIFSCDFKNEKLISAYPLLPFKIEFPEQINCFIYSSNKILWVGMLSGTIYQLDQNKRLQTFHIPENYPVRSFTEDMLHHIWVGTEKGLYIFSEDGVLIKKITTQNGLLNDCIYAMLPLKNKQAVFASSNLGLSYIPLNGQIINYTKESGLQENEFNTESAFKTANGKFYFGGINGITAFYPSSLSEIKDNPVINIIHLLINDSLYNFSPGIWRNDSIILNYNKNHLQLDVAALGLLNTDEYEYQYRLKGFEEKWQTTNQPTGIKYVLQPGNYLFEITCAPIFPSNSVFKKTIAIIISPPWWQTWWFKVLIIIIFIGIITFIVQQTVHRQYQKKLTDLQLQQEIQNERERISRDLHDNLGAYAAAIASNVATIKNSQNGNDLNILHQLKDNSQSIINQISDTIWALNKEAISLTSVSDRFKVFLQKIQPNHPHINIAIEENILNDQKLSPANALHLFRIMQEAVNNAIRHSEGNQINILITADKTWEIRIEDNGNGMNHSGTKADGGNGLKNMQTRIKQAGWTILWKQNIPGGTSVIISSTTN